MPYQFIAIKIYGVNSIQDRGKVHPSPVNSAKILAELIWQFCK